MANYATLKAAIQQVIKTNGNNEITGAILQQTLLSVVNSLGSQYQFAGVATPSTNPGTPDQNVAYIAGPGTYSNFNGTVIKDGYLGVFKYNGSWSIDTIGVSIQFTTPFYPCFMARTADHADVAVSVSGAENTVLSSILRGFLVLYLEGFNPAAQYFISLYRNGFNTNEYQIEFSSISGNTVSTIVRFYIPAAQITTPGGVNKIDVTSGTYRIRATIDLSTFPTGGAVTLRSSTYANFIVRPECFKSIDDELAELQEHALLDSDLSYRGNTANLANPEDIQTGKYITNSGAISDNSDWAMIRINVEPGKDYTFGGFYLGRDGYYAFYNGNSVIGSGVLFSDPNETQNPVTVTAPANATYLYIDIKTGSSPVNPYQYLMVNEGETLMNYIQYEKSVYAIKNIPIFNNDVRFSRIEQDLAQLNGAAVTDDDLKIGPGSSNLANPANISDGQYITNSGSIASNADWSLVRIDVTPGERYTFGGFYLGRNGYYAFYNGNSLIGSAVLFSDPNGTENPVTVLAPQNATYLYIDIKTGSSPATPYANLMVNKGTSLLDYVPYQSAIVAINNIPLSGAGAGPVDEQRISAIETNVAELQEDVAVLQDQIGGSVEDIIADLPVSDGTGISTGFAYIETGTGIVKIKM